MNNILILFLIFPILVFTADSSCTTDSDCDSLQLCINSACQHKNLFPGLSSQEIWAIFIVFFFVIVATVSGVGGGLVFLPLLMTLFNFSEKTSVIISITLVFLILSIRNLLSLSERCLYRDRYMINYDIVLIFSPSILMGSVFGTLLNEVAPTWIILLFLVFFMTFNVILTSQRALVLRAKTESRERKDINLSKDAKEYLKKVRKKIKELEKNYMKNEDPEDILSKKSLLEEKKAVPFVNLVEIHTEDAVSYQLPLEDATIEFSLPQLKRIERNLDEILFKESRLFDYEKLALLFANISIVIFLLMLRGNDNVGSLINVQRCSEGYWVLEFAYIPIGILFMFWAFRCLLKENARKKESGYYFHKHDVKWNYHSLLEILANGILVGLIASALGIGGSIISAPFLMRRKIETQEASFTASFCSFFSSFAAVFQYFIAGVIVVDYSVFYGFFAVVGMVIGLKIALVYLKKMDMLYVIPFALVLVMMISTVVNIISSVYTLACDESSWDFEEFC